MWGVIPIYIRRNTLISDKAKLLYAEISDCTDDDGVCRKSNEELGDYLGISAVTVRGYLYELRDLEILCVDGEGRDRRISFPERMVISRIEGKQKSVQPKKEELANEIVSLWNSSITKERNISLKPNLLKTIVNRSKSYSDDEILTAVKNRITMVNNSKWHHEKENLKFKRDIYLVLRSDKDLEHHMNMSFEQEKSKDNEINVYKF